MKIEESIGKIYLLGLAFQRTNLRTWYPNKCQYQSPVLLLQTEKSHLKWLLTLPLLLLQP
jgi:hypothetical protein